MNVCEICGKPIEGTRLLVMPNGQKFVKPRRAHTCGVNCRMVKYRAEKKRRLYERISNACFSVSA